MTVETVGATYAESVLHKEDEKQDLSLCESDSQTTQEQNDTTLTEADQCTDLHKDEAMEANIEALESVAALDHKVTQITSEMMEMPEVVSALDAGNEQTQTHQYIIQDDLPPSEKLEQETTAQSSDTVVPENTESTSTDAGAVIGQGETVHITNMEETDSVSVGSPEVVMSDVMASCCTDVTHKHGTIAGYLKSTNLTNLTDLLKANQQPRIPTKVSVFM